MNASPSVQEAEIWCLYVKGKRGTVIARRERERERERERKIERRE